ncbi:MAG: hypothetical protein HQK93_04820 [Nitrospirae bacterium]|nr:hypothetical protein [Nitrospirota bacterium]
MFTKLRKDFERGNVWLKWFGGVLSERLRIESSLLRIFVTVNSLENKRDLLMKDIGEQIFNMRNEPITDIYNVKVIRDNIKGIEELNLLISKTKKEAAEFNSIDIDSE